MNVFVDITEYMQKSREERRAHLVLDDACIMLGGTSYQFRGLLAHHLKTTLPSTGTRISVCHACNQGGCSNVQHLYWGTDRDNHLDEVSAGRYKTFHEKIINKLGPEGAKQHYVAAAKHRRSFGNRFTVPVSYEHYRESFQAVDRTQRGWKAKLARELNISCTHVTRIQRQLFNE